MHLYKCSLQSSSSLIAATNYIFTKKLSEKIKQKYPKNLFRKYDRSLHEGELKKCNLNHVFESILRYYLC